MPICTSLDKIEDSCPIYQIAIEDRSAPVTDAQRLRIPPYVPAGTYDIAVDGWRPTIIYARLWWWN